jgi:Trypsin-like peptidase domain
MRVLMMLLCPVVGLVTLLTSCGRPTSHASIPTFSSPRPSESVQRLSEPQHTAVAGPVDPDVRIGPIFLNGSTQHVCTGSVLHSTTGNLILTAAHCLAGASKIAFAPGFAGDHAPADIWVAEAVYLDPRWTASKDPHADYAIARVGRGAGGSVESHVGLALTLGTAPTAGSRVTVMGYPSGTGGQPIGCQTSTEVTDSGYPALACEGMVDGTSGAPWVSGTMVTGLIGGLEGGGCAENVSYSAPFDEHVAQLLTRAEAAGPGDTVPNDLTDVC